MGHFVGKRVLDVGEAPEDTAGHHFVEILYGGAFSGVRILCEVVGEGRLDDQLDLKLRSFKWFFYLTGTLILSPILTGMSMLNRSYYLLLPKQAAQPCIFLNLPRLAVPAIQS